MCVCAYVSCLCHFGGRFKRGRYGDADSPLKAASLVGVARLLSRRHCAGFSLKNIRPGEGQLLAGRTGSGGVALFMTCMKWGGVECRFSAGARMTPHTANRVNFGVAWPPRPHFTRQGRPCEIRGAFPVGPEFHQNKFCMVKFGRLSGVYPQITNFSLALPENHTPGPSV